MWAWPRAGAGSVQCRTVAEDEVLMKVWRRREQ
jgi:hypothetical protein